MRDAGGQSSPMAVVCSWREREKERKKEHAVLVSGRAEHRSKQKVRDGTMNDRFVICDYLARDQSRCR
jgi:hypothetical protein